MIEETEFDFENRIVSTEMTGEDTEVEINLRPKVFDDYIGQEKVKEMLKVYIDAAKGRNGLLQFGDAPAGLLGGFDLDALLTGGLV